MQQALWRGSVSFYKGQSAEEIVLRHYEDLDWRLCARRWRGAGAEIDLIFRRTGTVLFVEVKSAKNFVLAALSLGAGQRERLLRAADAYLLSEAPWASARFDLALVDGYGHLETLENALFQ